MGSAPPAVRRVGGLVRGYLLRMDRRAALVSVGVVTPLLVAWMVIPDADAATGFLDLMRSLVAASPFGGSFFRSPEVVSRPVTRRDLWRAQWLVATVGVTAAVFVLRLIAGVFQGNLQTPVLAQSAVADLIGTVVSAGVASALFNFNKPPAVRTLPAAVIMFGVAMAAVLGAPLWSPYLRAVVGTGVLSQVWCGIGAVSLALIGVRAVPSSLAPVRQGAIQWYDLEASHSRRARGPASRPWTASRDDGRWRWIGRKLRSAALVGLATALVAAVIAWLTADPEVASATFLQRLAGQFVGNGDRMSPLLIACGAVAWAINQLDDLRLIRLVPLSRVVVAATVTAGIVVCLSVSLTVQTMAYRAGFGFWPATSPILPIVGLACLAATFKTVRLVLPSRVWVIVLISAFVPIAMDAGHRWAMPIAGVPATIFGVGIIVSLLRIDIALLERSSRLYRGSPALL